MLILFKVVNFVLCEFHLNNKTNTESQEVRVERSPEVLSLVRPPSSAVSVRVPPTRGSEPPGMEDILSWDGCGRQRAVMLNKAKSACMA